MSNSGIKRSLTIQPVPLARSWWPFSSVLRKQKFCIHKKLICKSSKFFDRAFNGGFMEATTGELDLPEDNPVIFEHFVGCLYRTNVDYSDDDQSLTFCVSLISGTLAMQSSALGCKTQLWIAYRIGYMKVTRNIDTSLMSIQWQMRSKELLFTRILPSCYSLDTWSTGSWPDSTTTNGRRTTFASF